MEIYGHLNDNLEDVLKNSTQFSNLLGHFYLTRSLLVSLDLKGRILLAVVTSRRSVSEGGRTKADGQPGNKILIWVEEYDRYRKKLEFLFLMGIQFLLIA